jgi:glycerol-3-phosphate dehydrogenase
MWMNSYRETTWQRIDTDWDLLVIGGGITGAGILREASRLGLRSLLVEQQDFAWGTSSRSSKLVHGGLRYLKQGRFDLTRASVQARERLLQEGSGLIDPLGFLLSVYKGDFPGRWSFEVGLTVYDMLALRWDHAYYSPQAFEMLAPHISRRDLQGGFRYGDAQTDDARLVLRVLQESLEEGADALNYVQAKQLLFANGAVQGVELQDMLQDRKAIVCAKAIVNATGAWADHLRTQVQGNPHIRPLRGSHLIFPSWRLPVAQAVSFLHPLDNRPVFIFPWEGITLVGTTDVDHNDTLDKEPHISPEETAYLMAAVEATFPSLGLGIADVISTYAGVRPVIGSGKIDPSKESRDHMIWEENGLLTITGGKLTTFREIARDTLEILRPRFPDLPLSDPHTPVLNPVNVVLPEAGVLDQGSQRRLLGRYGRAAAELASTAQTGELTPIQGTNFLWAELRWAARAEAVAHLDDLMLRRTRLGLLLPEGGRAIMPEIRKVCQTELGWNDEAWKKEEIAYLNLWQQNYSLPPAENIPNWKLMLSQARLQRQTKLHARQRAARRASLGAFLAVLLGLIFFITYLVNRERTQQRE